MLRILNQKACHKRDYKEDVRGLLGVAKFALPDAHILIAETSPLVKAVEDNLIEHLDSFDDALSEKPTDLYAAAMFLLAYTICDRVWRTDIKSERGPDFAIERNVAALANYKFNTFQGGYIRHMENLGVAIASMPVISVMIGDSTQTRPRVDGT
jgi:hypothetical protein